MNMKVMGPRRDGLSEAVVLVSLTGLVAVLPFARSAGMLAAGRMAAILQSGAGRVPPDSRDQDV